MNRERIKSFFGNRTVKILLIAAAALLLLLAVWKVFFRATDKPTPYEATAQEERLSNLLSQIEGVQNATVMISLADGAPVGSILTRIRVIDVASNALNLKKELILVYPS